MRFSRARYVTLCQQSLVTAAVLAVGLSAAGVKTLDIVPQPGAAAGTPGMAPGNVQGNAGNAPAQAFADNLSHDRAEVDTAPVTPKVREVAVTSKPSAAARTSKPQPHAAQPQTEKSTQPTTIEKIDPAGPGFVETAPQKVTGYATIGVTWAHGVNYADGQIKIQQRTLKSGTWSPWSKVSYHDDHGPDGLSTEEESARERPGTDALVIGDVDQVQMRAQTADGVAPPDLKLAIIDPGTGKMTKAAPAIDTAKLPPSQGGVEPQADGQTLQGDGTQDTVALSAMKRVPRPYIYSRAQWGANEKMREQSPPSYGTVKTGFVHHTVNANNYTSAQVPALLRGIYAYHTQSRGWRDIGYNFLVDRFGRIWEGRWGGVGRAVVGAHTLGYNEVSFAMSAIGNFDIAQPPTAVLQAYARLFAWKLSIYNIRANDPSVVVKGRTLKAINGHRDVGQTACPGRYLYAKLPWIRQRARTIQLDAQSGTGSPAPTPPAKPPVFTSPTQTPRAAASQPKITFPKSSNLVGSSYPDLLVKKRSTGAVTILPTGGQTGFRGTATTPGGWRAMNLLAAVGDVTGDGKGDVMARATRTGVTRIYRGNGTGHVGQKGFYATTRFRPANMLIGAGDWNGDGKNDLLMRTKSGALYVVHGTGRGTFGSPHLLSKDWAGYSSTAVAGDLTGDGRPDIVAVKGGYTYVVPMVVGAKLGTPVKRRALGAANARLVGGAGDLTGDGVGDVVVQSKSGSLNILTGGANGILRNWLGPFTAGAGLRRISSAQMGGGAQPDVVGVDKTGKKLVTVFSNGLTNLGKPIDSKLTVKDSTQLLSVGDWNRGGRSDVITREDDGDSLVLHRGTGTGTFSTPVLMSKGWKSFTRLAAVGDVTGDKLPDLIGKTASGPMTIFPSNGKTGFQAPILAPATLRTFNEVSAASAWKPGNLPGSAFISSDGSFVPFGGTSGAGDLAGYDWVIGPGDMDGDGVADLVVHSPQGVLYLLPGTSTGYLERRFIASGYASYSLGG